VPTVVTGTVLVVSQVFGILLDIGSLVFRQVVPGKKLFSRLLLMPNVASGSVSIHYTPNEATQAPRGMGFSPLMSIVTK